MWGMALVALGRRARWSKEGPPLWLVRELQSRRELLSNRLPLRAVVDLALQGAVARYRAATASKAAAFRRPRPPARRKEREESECSGSRCDCV